MQEIYAYAGKILRINLSNGKILTESTSNYTDGFLGGRGINQWILYNEVKPGIWPFDPANRLIFGTGILVGTLTPGACRYSVDAKNPLTGGVGSSNAGGHFGPELKFAGYDHIVIQGKSRKPCYLWIKDNHIEIEDASHLWGKTTWETEDLIKEELNDDDIQIASIGPAGENLVRGACIINNGERAAGKCGTGAVMGSKNLKAIVVQGEKEIEVAYPDKFIRVVERLLEKIANNDDMKMYIEYGCALFLLEGQNKTGALPVRNFQDGFWDPKKVEKTHVEQILRHSTRRLACFNCPVHCSHYLEAKEGPFAGTKGEGFKLNTLYNFGPRLDIDYLPAIIKAHILCSQLGLDVDTTSGVIAWAMECYEKGIFNKKDADGLELKWGNYEVVLELIKKIAHRDGFGDLLAEGSWRASKIVGKGSEKYSMTIKGQELYEGLRTAKAWALGSIVSTRGCCHLRGSPAIEQRELTREEGEKFFGIPTAGNRKAYEGKAKLVIFFENFKAIVDCMGICYPLTQWSSPYLIDLKDLSELYSTATGKSLKPEKLLRIGERIQNVEKAFNVREGMTRKDDKPPQRFFEPIKSVPGKGERLEKKKFEKMLSEYYALRCWEVETGLPRERKLRELGLESVAEELKKMDFIKD
ncbi:MAG: aldehyde ferredoxin oxidoreductase family protein [Candidatus Bathyarchaeia archaeon]